MTSLLFNRLLAVGHTHDNLSHYFLQAIEKIEDRECNYFLPPTSKSSSSSSSENVFLHIPYHPRDISRTNIQNIYKSTCESNYNSNGKFSHLLNNDTKEFMKISKLTIAYSRPKNLRDLLVPSKLTETDTINVENFILPKTPTPKR